MAGAVLTLMARGDAAGVFLPRERLDFEPEAAGACDFDAGRAVREDRLFCGGSIDDGADRNSIWCDYPKTVLVVHAASDSHTSHSARG